MGGGRDIRYERRSFPEVGDGIATSPCGRVVRATVDARLFLVLGFVAFLRSFFFGGLVFFGADDDLPGRAVAVLKDAAPRARVFGVALDEDAAVQQRAVLND